MSDPGLLKFELVTEEPAVLAANTIYFVKNATVNRIVISGNLPQDPLRVTSTTALENIASKLYIASGNTKEEARNSIDAADINHTHPEASGTVPGFLSTALYTKLMGLSNYVHPTSDGNLHVPATGTTNNGKVLKAGATAGSMSWSELTNADVGLPNVNNTSDANKPVSTAQASAIATAKSEAAADATSKANAAQAAAIAASTPSSHAGSTGSAHGVATAAVHGFMSSTDKSKLDGIAAGATANTGTVTGVTATLPIVSSGGTAPIISINAATTSTAGSMSAADKTKLDAISGSNTGDETTASIKSKLGVTILSGSNTGDQTSVTGNAGTATKLATSRTINGVAFDGSANITINAVDSTARIAASEKGAINGVATLGADGTVPLTQLPPLSSGGTELLTIDYESRGDLRTTVGNYAVVEGLGLFIFYPGSDEPDDDESCFATTTGRWLLEAVSWDVVDSWYLPEISYRETTTEEIKQDILNLNANVDSINTGLITTKFLFASKGVTITSVAKNTQVTEVITVTGATTNDHVIITPPNALSFRISIYGRVTSPDTVTIYINNSTATSQSITTGTWEVVVIKEN